MSSASIEDATEFVLDGTHGSPIRTETGIPVLSAQNVKDGALDYETDRHTSAAEYEAFKKRLALEPGDVLLTIVGTIGRAAVLEDVRPLVFQRSVAVIRPRKDLLSPRFLYHVSQSQTFQAQLARASNQSSQAGVYLGKLKKLRIPLPPLPEQRRIAEILDKADAVRAKRRAALAQLDTLTQSIFLDMFGDPIANPRRFPVRPMIELVDSARPISYGILMPGPDQPDGIKYVRVVDMRDGGIELPGIRKTTEAISNAFRRSLLEPGDLLMSIRGHVGRFAVVPPELNGANITQDTARLAITGADPVFVRECLRTQGFQRWMGKHTKGVAVRGINLGDVKLMPIIAPELSVQRRFARLARAADELKAAARAAMTKLDALVASLQHRAFRGEL
jgi:type I restriction enzyme S subunit